MRDVLSEMQLSGRGTRLESIILKGVTRDLKPEIGNSWQKNTHCTGPPGPNGGLACNRDAASTPSRFNDGA